MPRGAVILGHGSRAPEGNGVVRELAAMVQARRRRLLVRPAYLAFDRPTLGEAVQELVAAGAQEVIVVPLFLGNGNHMRRDIPQLVQEEEARYGGRVRLLLAANLGTDPRLASVLVERIREAEKCISSLPTPKPLPAKAGAL